MAGKRGRSGRRPLGPSDEALLVAVQHWLDGSARSQREAVTWALQITGAQCSDSTVRRQLVAWLEQPSDPILYDELVLEALYRPGMSGMIMYKRDAGPNKFVLGNPSELGIVFPRKHHKEKRTTAAFLRAFAERKNREKRAVDRVRGLLSKLNPERKSLCLQIAAAIDALIGIQVAAHPELWEPDAQGLLLGIPDPDF